MPSSPPAASNAIILVIDRLGAGWLGPYGNTWLDTMAFNRLAAESLLFEFALADSPQLPSIYRSFDCGRHAVSTAAAQPSLAACAAQAGLRTALITDAETLAPLPFTAEFHDRIQLTPAPHETAPDVESTGFAHLLAAAVEWLQQHASQPFLLWLHADGLQGAWDAPLELRNRFADEGDPCPPDLTTPPQRLLREEDDPDELLGLMHAYAGQVTAIDMTLGRFLDALRELQLDDKALLAVTAARGFALGEHGVVGAADDLLYGELLNVPLLLRTPKRDRAAERLATLVQPADLYWLLRHWCGGPVADRPTLLELSFADEEAACWQVACAAADGRQAIRTPAWFLTQAASGAPQLYVKPDDRWEANEISDRCPGIVEELVKMLRISEQLVTAHGVAGQPPLSAKLRYGLE